MATLKSNGILLVDSLPTHTPVGDEATLARLENTTTHYYYNGTMWVTADFGDNIYAKDGLIPSGANRKVTLGGSIEFLDQNQVGSSVKIFNDVNEAYYTNEGGKSHVGIIFEDAALSSKVGVYLEKGLVVDISTGGLIINVGFANTQFRLDDNTMILNNSSFDFVCNPSAIRFIDKTVSKAGIMLQGFGETNSDDTAKTANYSTLVNTSLVPKRYVDELVKESFKEGIVPPGAIAADYRGQEYIDTATEIWYKNTSPNTWKQITN